MSTIDREPDWAACPSGALGHLDRRLRAKRHRSLLRESAALIVLAASIGLTAGYLASPGADARNGSPPAHFAGISCDEVRGQLPELTAGRLGQARAAQVHEHLRQCPKCRQLMERMRSGKVARRDRSEAARLARVSPPAPRR